MTVDDLVVYFTGVVSVMDDLFEHASGIENSELLASVLKVGVHIQQTAQEVIESIKHRDDDLIPEATDITKQTGSSE